MSSLRVVSLPTHFKRYHCSFPFRTTLDGCSSPRRVLTCVGSGWEGSSNSLSSSSAAAAAASPLSSSSSSLHSWVGTCRHEGGGGAVERGDRSSVVRLVGFPGGFAKPGKMKPLKFFKFNFGTSSLPEVVQAGDPILHEVAEQVPLEKIGTPEIQDIIDQMIQVMRNAPGVGLAAPQIGIPLQIIVLEDTEELMSYCPKDEVIEHERKPFDLLVFINPQLRTIGDEKARFFEGCLSVNGYRALVERNLKVEVEGYDRNGSPIKVIATGWQARIFQHEYDHLNGTLYVERMVGKSFRAAPNLRLPLASSCPKPGKM